MSEEHVLYEVKDYVAWLTLNREARRNALSPEAIDLLDDYLGRARDDAAVRVVCLTGAGDKAFCAGADLGSAMGGGGSGDAMRAYARLLGRMDRFPKPLVARVNGHCMAGGLGLLLSCDIAYAHEGARFGTPEVGVGLFPMMIGALILRNTQRGRALEMIYSARKLGAADACEMGLVTRVFPKEELDDAVLGLLRDIVGNAPAAIALGRKALAHVAGMELDEALQYLCDRLGDVLKTEDAAEGLSAFFEKRPPVWKGR